ncbi:arabinogalactan endo-1,4-beta-galactosidase domain protein [Enterococcus faecium V689]|nr:glycosyl hydrolase 53 family protein [Enterococcus faecium]EJX40549.1 arabinogalactan endo-1,4-beta-galactosidase domain protein [Enterococcus faecium V689]EJY32269.1 arabinogalactan endo-1,4-beta-galactosidase domain protein [Enterococcus faecium 513]MBJ8166144.1 glycosyl hydrolase 53 family protein [Enterococcus faecium]QQF14772.1 glycosyl hydrolase 53 family protein [Enterococcus faecium]RYK33564.1 beta-1,4-galactanase [Enterococcus faecium]
MKMGIWLRKAVLFAAVLGALGAVSKTVEASASEFIRGADISILSDMEKSGAKYYEDDISKDALEILKNNGVNYVRLRLWQDPYNSNGESYGAGTNDLETTIDLAKRAKNLGLKVLLDFHYSDFWVDPGKQNLPKAWQGLTFEEMNTALYDYTKNVLSEMKQLDVYPDMVQIGNELNSGMLWPYGKSWGEGGGEFDRLAAFLKSGIQAVRDTQPKTTPVMLHLADGGDTGAFTWWFDEITSRGVSFDLIGVSYYPYWHGSMNELQTNMNAISQRYGKEVIVVETAYGHTTANADTMPNAFGEAEAAAGGYEPTPTGQAEYLLDLADRIQAVPNNRGAGFFYWEPLWYNGNVSWATQAGMNYLSVQSTMGNEWDNQAMFDFAGNALPSLRAFKQAGAQINLVKNASFESDGPTTSPSNWQTWFQQGTAKGTIKTEAGTFFGDYKLTFWQDQAYEASAYQNVSGISKGTYTLSAYVMSGGEFDTNQLYIKNYGGAELNTAVVKTSEWTKITIKDIPITTGVCEIGVYSKASGNAWTNVDFVSLVKQWTADRFDSRSEVPFSHIVSVEGRNRTCTSPLPKITRNDFQSFLPKRVKHQTSSTLCIMLKRVQRFRKKQ